MSADRMPGDEGLESPLVRFHEALVAGSPPAPSAPDPVFDAPMAQAKACLCALERLRQTGPAPVNADIDRDAVSFGENPIRGPENAGEPYRFGRFVILEELGRGGHGIVYRARDPILQRDVALKIPRIETLASPQRRQRFLRESRAVAALCHPHLVPVYECGEVGPACYVASQYCSGPTLAEWLTTQHQPVAPRVAAALVAALAETVAYVHAHGVLHRDIKPANVLLEFGSGGPAARLPFTPKLTDFGLAKLLTESNTKTQTGSVIGTPQYMAPEQAAGRTREIGATADIYALGAILYELLSGRAPIDGGSDLELLRKAAEGHPAPLRRIRPEVRGDLQAVCMKCLEFESSRRYASASDLADDLNRYLRGESVSVRRPGPIGQLARWCRRKPVVAGLTISLVLALTGGFAASIWQWRASEAHRAAAEENFRLAHQALREMQTTLYEGDKYDAPEFQRLRRELLQSGVKYYRAFMDKEPSDHRLREDFADACYQVAYIGLASGDKAEALKWHQQALPLWESLSSERPEVRKYRFFLAKSLDQMGLIHSGMKRWETAEASCSRALALRKELADEDPDNLQYQSDLADTCFHFANVLRKQARHEESVEMLARARRIQEALISREPASAAYRSSLARTLYSLAYSTKVEGRSLDRIELCQRALQLQEGLASGRKGSEKDLRHLAQTLNLLGTLHAGAGQLADAENAFRRSTAAFETLCEEWPTAADNRSGWARSLAHLGELQRESGHPSEALICFSRACAILEALTDEQPENDDSVRQLAAASRQLAECHRDAGRRADALRLLERSARLYERLSERNPESPAYAQSLRRTRREAAVLQSAPPTDAVQ